MDPLLAGLLSDHAQLRVELGACLAPELGRAELLQRLRRGRELLLTHFARERVVYEVLYRRAARDPLLKKILDEFTSAKDATEARLRELLQHAGTRSTLSDQQLRELASGTLERIELEEHMIYAEYARIRAESGL